MKAIEQADGAEPVAQLWVPDGAGYRVHSVEDTVSPWRPIADAYDQNARDAYLIYGKLMSIHGSVL